MTIQQQVCFGAYRLVWPDGQLWCRSEVVHLPPKALAVLWELASQAGNLVSKSALFDTVWAGTVVSDGALSVCIGELRRALGDNARKPRYIETVHRRGYRFVAAVEQMGPVTEQREGAVTRLPAALVGREAEVAQFHAALERARSGQRQVLFISGEAGIGKTTLVEACVASLGQQDAGWVGWGQCVEAYGAGTGYLPVLEALGRLCRGPAESVVIDTLRQWAPTWLVQLAGVVPEADQEQLYLHTRGATRERLLRELAEALEILSSSRLLVLVLEDLHWSDASTVDVLTMLARRRESAHLVVLGTYRPQDLVAQAHPLRQAVAELQLHGHCTELALSYLQPLAVDAYVSRRFPAYIASTIAPVMYQRTTGHPLLMAQLAEYLAQQIPTGARPGDDLASEVTASMDVIPTEMQQFIVLQLERLSRDEQRVLEMASVAGVEFTAACVAAGIQTSAEHVETVCEQLVRQRAFLETRELAVWPDGTLSGQYRFRHALYQQVLYQRLTDVRQLQGNRRIGERLAAGYGARTGEIAAELAVHFERGREPDRASFYHAQAGEQALVRFAYPEAMFHLTAGLELLNGLPDTPEYCQRRLSLLLKLGTVLLATKGQADAAVEQVYSQARMLCQQLGDTSQLLQALGGLRKYYVGQGALQTARELGEHCLTLAQQLEDVVPLVNAHYELSNVLFWLGELGLAQTHLERGIALYDPDQHLSHATYGGFDPGVGCRIFSALVLSIMGYPDQALKWCNAAITLAQELSHPYSLAMTLMFAAMFYQLRREPQMVQQYAEETIALAGEQGLARYVGMGMGTGLQGWARVEQGQVEEGLAQMRHGLTVYTTSGVATSHPYFMALLAEKHGEIGCVHEGLSMLDDAMTMVNKNGLRLWEPELYRLKGELLLALQGGDGKRHKEAEVSLRQAIELARLQQARIWELRATMAQARLWHAQGRRDAARELLEALYRWFSEGLDTADLRQARSLLAELG